MTDFYADDARLRQLRIKNLKRQDALFGAIYAQEQQEKLAGSSAIILNDHSEDLTKLLSNQDYIYDEDVARDQVFAYLRKLTGDENTALSISRRFDMNGLVFILKNQKLINKELKKINNPGSLDFKLLVDQMMAKDSNFLRTENFNRQPEGELNDGINDDAGDAMSENEYIPPLNEDLRDEFGVASAEKRAERRSERRSEQRGVAERQEFQGQNPMYLPDDYENPNVTVRRKPRPVEYNWQVDAEEDAVVDAVVVDDEPEGLITPAPNRNQPIAVTAEAQNVDLDGLIDEEGRYKVLDIVNNSKVWKSLGVKQLRIIHSEIATYDKMYLDEQLFETRYIPNEDGVIDTKISKKDKAGIKSLWLSIESRKKVGGVDVGETRGKGLNSHSTLPPQQKLHHSNQISNMNKQPVRLIYGRGLRNEENVVERTNKKTITPIYKAHCRYFDKIFIDMNRLKDNQLFIKYIYNNVTLKQLPTMTISDDLKEIVMDTINNRYNKKIFNTLDENDKRIFRLVVKAFKLNNKIELPEEEDVKEFKTKYRVLVGSYLSGNDSTEIKKELLKYVRLGLAMKTIPSNEAYSLIYELSA